MLLFPCVWRQQRVKTALCALASRNHPLSAYGLDKYSLSVLNKYRVCATLTWFYYQMQASFRFIKIFFSLANDCSAMQVSAAFALLENKISKVRWQVWEIDQPQTSWLDQCSRLQTSKVVAKTKRDTFRLNFSKTIESRENFLNLSDSTLRTCLPLIPHLNHFFYSSVHF